MMSEGIYNIDNFLWQTAGALVSTGGVYQSFTLQNSYWSHGQLMGWSFIWSVLTIINVFALSGTIREMKEV